MSEKSKARPRAQSENEPGCKPKADILLGKKVHADVAYLIRLREDWDTRVTFHIKSMKDFEELNKKLKAASESETKECAIAVLPELPISGSRFGIRRNLSALGVGSFLDRQHEGLQQYIQTILLQVPNLSADENLQAFFPDEVPPGDIPLHKAMKADIFSSPTLAQIKGFWRVPGSDRIWTIEESGRALLDNKWRGEEYDLHEHGTVGIDLAVDRTDGWAIDIPRSSKDQLIWSFAGGEAEDELVWNREPDVSAAAHFKELAARAEGAFEAPPKK